METTKARLRSTQLNDRTLWFDGDSSFDPENLEKVVRRFAVKFVDYENDTVKEFNKQVSRADAIEVKQECNPIFQDWVLPFEYRRLDVVGYVFDKHYEMYKNSPNLDARERRLSEELLKYERFGFIDVLRAIIFIINKLTDHNVVWGVGRGSSVSSYVLYTIGVHDVDSFAYDLNIDDFLH